MARTNIKTERVEVRLTPRERLKLEAQAQKRGQSLSDYIRGKTVKK
tara:strand:+ start:509 stop:646 length:138 start_codon:yes stop_codon:yes gene_type:complete